MFVVFTFPSFSLNILLLMMIKIRAEHIQVSAVLPVMVIIDFLLAVDIIYLEVGVILAGSRTHHLRISYPSFITTLDCWLLKVFLGCCIVCCWLLRYLHPMHQQCIVIAIAWAVHRTILSCSKASLRLYHSLCIVAFTL